MSVDLLEAKARLGVVVAVAASVLVGCATNRVPEAFPELDPSTTRDALVVVEPIHGGYLPDFPSCVRPGAICMDPPPFWIWADIKDVVFGEVPHRGRIAVSATSHYGMEGTIREGETTLMRLMSDGASFEMLRYAQAFLSPRRDGELVLVVGRSDPIWWLPCEAMALAEPIDAADFAVNLAIDPDRFPPEELESQSRFWKVTPEGVLPRLGIPMAKLSEALAARYGGGKLPRCEGDVS